MGYLSFNDLKKIGEEILRTIGYESDIRKIFLSDIMIAFRTLMSRSNNERSQLDLDLNKLNDTERLTDGSIPFQSWLSRAEQYVQADPEASEIIQQALALIGTSSLKAAPVQNVAAPSRETMIKIVKEKVIFQNDLLSYSFLEAGVHAGKGIVRLKVPRYENGAASVLNAGGQTFYSGTGWLLTRALLITNHHVINARNEHEPNAIYTDLELQCEHSSAEFDFNSDNMIPRTLFIEKLEVMNEDLDFAILRLRTAADCIPPGRFPNEVNIGLEGPTVVNIIQHPFGHSKKIAIRNNHIYKTDYPKLFYFTDTEKGSSGSPVFNDRWLVIALHRASKPIKDVSYQGKTTGWVNEGVQLKAIFDWLKTNCKTISDEVMNN